MGSGGGGEGGSVGSGGGGEGGTVGGGVEGWSVAGCGDAPLVNRQQVPPLAARPSQGLKSIMSCPSPCLCSDTMPHRQAPQALHLAFIAQQAYARPACQPSQLRTSAHS